MTRDANVQGYLLVKSDRINQRISNFARTVKKQNKLIAVEDFNEFIKAMQIMIAQELTYEGIKKEEIQGWTGKEKLRTRLQNTLKAS